ncbi:exonuclease domain-containing protein [Sporolactobacillus kofuensis]|uniref:Exonuclease domain-containing protein n=1 Tax=Sporolactobacillus kofuensis TaxID=269672 RepID=A0ABW1WEA9_9BACL|nr:exonuclease domain-containing protein [Sporolactobacillus kofuensis]MCO7174773.1 exonuclease domain-containing protein [Sporolactobacillus kofuensis]
MLNELNYVVIDFETANESRASACSLGMLKVIDGKITDSYYSLINPETYFDSYNTYIHGITEEDVASAPTYPTTAENIQNFVDNLPVVAHFAPFDTGVIRESNQRYGIHFEFDYFDSYSLSRSLIDPKLLSYKLNKVADYFGYQSFEHHHALEDCKACSYIVNELARAFNAKSLDELIKLAGYPQFGHVNQDESWKPFRKRYSSGSSSDLFNSLDFSKAKDANSAGYFYGKSVVFTGKLLSMQRKNAMQHVINAGGNPQKGINKMTNVLVVGKEDPKVVGSDGKSSKIKKVEQLLSDGLDIQIMDEDEFLKMING